MRKRIRYLMCLMMLFWMFPINAYAEEKENCTLISVLPHKKTVTFLIGENREKYADAVPGDVLSEVITLKNDTKEPVKIRLAGAENINQSSLYKEIEVEDYGSFENMKSGWYIISPHGQKVFHIKMRFPEELGNGYQRARLCARIYFECRSGKKKSSFIKTGDDAGILFYILTALSGLLIGVSVVINRRRNFEYAGKMERVYGNDNSITDSHFGGG